MYMYCDVERVQVRNRISVDVGDKPEYQWYTSIKVIIKVAYTKSSLWIPVCIHHYSGIKRRHLSLPTDVVIKSIDNL